MTLGCGDDGQRGDGRLEIDDDVDDEEEEEGGSNNNPRPVVSNLDLPGQKRAVAVAAGANHSIVLGEDGVAYAFGANDLGQCGITSGDVASDVNVHNNADGNDDDDEDEEESTAIALPTPVLLPKGTGK